MSAKELGEWAEFYNLEPWGWDAECFSAGIVAATIANVNRDPKKKPKPFEASDFVPGSYERKKAQPIDAKKLKAQMRLAFAGAYGRKPDVENNGGKGDGKSPQATRPQRRKKGGGQIPKSRG